jgi:hypothetical protein
VTVEPLAILVGDLFVELANCGRRSGSCGIPLAGQGGAVARYKGAYLELKTEIFLGLLQKLLIFLLISSQNFRPCSSKSNQKNYHEHF